MEDKMLELLSEEGRKFHEEFTRCQTMEEIDELKERWDRLNESRNDKTSPQYDMTLEEFDKNITCHLMRKCGKEWEARI